ncbi:MAG: phosphatase [Mucilaginibacter sp.]|jgi:protein tyrosine phosphatase (PTP) superfamily phosphohydrolase (DUF442 family)|nr:phosphatase [Mucilaginibacter sp.]MDB5016528.1 phosphatase [Mucilaginibacter sp.]
MNAINNFNKITDLLSCSGQPTADQLKQLAADNYQVVVNLGMSDGKYALPDEAASVKSANMDYYHIPVVFDDPQLTELGNFINFMKSQRDKKILVHCAVNYRASSFTGLYLFAAGQLDEQQMQLFIEDVWQPDAVWQQFIDDSIAYIKNQNV